MANKIQHYRTGTAGRVPDATKMLEGQLAINLVDKKIYSKYGNNVVTIGHGEGATINGNNTWTGTVKANRLESPTLAISSNTALNTATVSGVLNLNNTVNINSTGSFNVASSSIFTGTVNLNNTVNINSTGTLKVDSPSAFSNKISAVDFTSTGNSAFKKSIRVFENKANRHIVFSDTESGDHTGLIWNDTAGNINFRMNNDTNSEVYFDTNGTLYSRGLSVGEQKPGADRKKAIFWNKQHMVFPKEGAFVDNSVSDASTTYRNNLIQAGAGNVLGELIFCEAVGKWHGFQMYFSSGGASQFRNGNIWTTGFVSANNFETRSDIRCKKDLVKIDNALGKINLLNGYTYKLQTPDDQYQKELPSGGLIAQEVKEVLPEIVSTDDDGLYKLNYNGVIGLLVNAVNELNKKVERLENRNL